MRLLLEDTQWMDEESQRTIWQAIRRFSRLPVTLFITSTGTDGPLHEGLAFLLRSGGHGVLARVEPLSIDDVGHFLRQELGIPVEGETLQWIAHATGGYPALLSSLVDQVRLGGGPAHLIPTVVRLGRGGLGRFDVVAQHAETAAASSTALREALLAVAMAGELHRDQLETVLARHQLAPVDPTSLTETGLVDRAPGGRLRIRHQLAKEAVLERASRAERQSTHAALAEALDGGAGLEHRVLSADHAALPSVLADIRQQLDRANSQTDFALAFQLARIASLADASWMVEVVLAALRAGRPRLLHQVSDQVEALPSSVTRTCAMVVQALEAGDYRGVAGRLPAVVGAAITDPRELIISPTQHCWSPAPPLSMPHRWSPSTTSPWHPTTGSRRWPTIPHGHRTADHGRRRGTGGGTHRRRRPAPHRAAHRSGCLAGPVDASLGAQILRSSGRAARGCSSSPPDSSGPLRTPSTSRARSAQRPQRCGCRRRWHGP